MSVELQAAVVFYWAFPEILSHNAVSFIQKSKTSKSVCCVVVNDWNECDNNVKAKFHSTVSFMLWSAFYACSRQQIEFLTKVISIIVSVKIWTEFSLKSARCQSKAVDYSQKKWSDWCWSTQLYSWLLTIDYDDKMWALRDVGQWHTTRDNDDRVGRSLLSVSFALSTSPDVYL